MPEITDFDSFLETARAQPEPQRLLFILAKSVLPEDADQAEIERYHAGAGGALLPVMYVDKSPEEVTGFDMLVEESRQMGEDWHIMLTAALPGSGGEPPSQSSVEDAFSLIIKTIHAGGDLSTFLAFDRDGDPVQFSPTTRPIA